MGNKNLKGRKRRWQIGQLRFSRKERTGGLNFLYGLPSPILVLACKKYLISNPL